MRALLAVVTVCCACGGGGGSDDTPIDSGTRLGEFACAGTECSAGSDWCFAQSAGIQHAVTVGCNTLPAACTSTPTCDCIEANSGVTCPAATPTCTENNGNVTVTCGDP